jgi:hypothetical protein
VARKVAALARASIAGKAGHLLAKAATLDRPDVRNGWSRRKSRDQRTEKPTEACKVAALARASIAGKAGHLLAKAATLDLPVV